MFSAEALLMLRLRKDGYKVLLEPAAQYYHVNEADPQSLRATYFYWHRSFSYSRARLFNWSLTQRAFRVAITPMLPWWYLAKTLSYIVTTRRDQLGKFIRTFPMMLTYHYSAAMGQAMGLVFGRGDAGERFSERERGVKRVIRI
jgi:GT2 family glycosyltransferase